MAPSHSSYRQDGPSWVGWNAEETPLVENLSNQRVILLERNAPFPDEVRNPDNCYVYDHTDLSTPANDPLRTRELAELLGVGVNAAEASGKVWICYDVEDGASGQQAPAAVLANAQMIRGKGVVESNGVVFFIKEVEKANLLDEIGKVKKTGASDPRLNSDVDFSAVSKPRRFEDEADRMTLNVSVQHWGLVGSTDGPRAVEENVHGIVETGGDPESFDVSWGSALNLGENFRARHKSRVIHDILKAAVCKDGLNVKNLLCMEKLVRRARYIQRAQRREDLGTARTRFYQSSTRDAFGGIKTGRFDAWIEDQQQNLNKTLKAEAAYLTAVKDREKAAEKPQRGFGKGD